jgi:FMN reductase
MIDVVTLSGSPSPTARASRLLDTVQEQLVEQGLTVGAVSIRDLSAEDLVNGNFASPELKRIQEIVEQAKALVISTPVYKASYTGVLKALLDLLPQYAFEGKTILPMAVGGTLNHLLCIDYAMKPLFSVMGATQILKGVYILSTQMTFDDQGILILEEDINNRLRSALSELQQIVRCDLK